MIGTSFGNEKMSKKTTIKWLRDEIMKPNSGSSETVMHKDKTIATVYCIYRVLTDQSRPNFGNNFSQ